jgi:hypothetical protein
MKSYKDLHPEQVDSKTKEKYLQSIIDKLENVEFSPFKNLKDSLSIISIEKNIGFFVNYDIFHESRDFSTEKRGTSERIGKYAPLTNSKNINEWSYEILPNKKFLNHSVSHFVDDSQYIDTCHTCKGHGEINCFICKGNGQCFVCSGRGENSCDCGNGNCSGCAGRGEKRKSDGSGFERCTRCSGSGKHETCKGTGKIKCHNCRGNGNCTTCSGSGKETCHRCNGYGNMLYYLLVTANYSNSNEMIQLTPTINTYNPVNLNELNSKNEIIIEKEEIEFNLDRLSSFYDINEINRFLFDRKNDCALKHILNERIQIIKMGIYTIKYSLNNQDYTSYFIGENDNYFYENNPLQEFNRSVNTEIEKLTKQTNYSEAKKLLEEQITRYEAINDENGKNTSVDKLNNIKLEIQKDLRKGAFFAQLAFILFDFVSILFIFYSMNSNNDKIIFQWILLPIIFYRIGLYFKHLIPKFLFKDFEYSLVNQCINGDDKSDYYHINTKLLNFLRVTGVLGVIVFFIFNYDKNISTSLAISLVVYLLYYGITLVTTMMIDIYKHRRLDEKTLSLKNSASRILHSFSFNVLVVSLIGVIVFFTSAIFADGTIKFYWFELRDHIDTGNRSTIDGLNLFLNNSIYFLISAIGLYALQFIMTKKNK